MDKCLFNHVKKSSAFSKFDVILYAIVIALIIFVFCLVSLGKPNEVSGFDVSYENQKIITYDFENNTYSIFSKNVSVNTDGDKISFTITTNDNDVNVVQVDVKEKSVFMKDANCKNGDCLSFKPIKVGDKNSLIYCANHDIKISATGKDYTPPVSGE